jgi:nitroreductase
MYGYDDAPAGSRAARMGRVMQSFVDHLERVPVILLACSELEAGHTWLPTDGGSVYPAVQNLLLAARALGYGGVVSAWHRFMEEGLREILAIPDRVFIFATVMLGRPAGRHGPVRRLPVGEVTFDDRWGRRAAWAVDPPGTRFSSFKKTPREVPPTDPGP